MPLAYFRAYQSESTEGEIFQVKIMKKEKNTKHAAYEAGAIPYDLLQLEQ